jgi:hypothetical protein
MTGLVRYLDNPAVEVASMAARTIWLLSTCPGNRPALLAQPGLFDRLVGGAHWWCLTQTGTGPRALIPPTATNTHAPRWDGQCID